LNEKKVKSILFLEAPSPHNKKRLLNSTGQETLKLFSKSIKPFSTKKTLHTILSWGICMTVIVKIYVKLKISYAIPFPSFLFENVFSSHRIKIKNKHQKSFKTRA